MHEAIHALLLALPALFSIVNPLSGAFIFAAVTADRQANERGRLARQVATYSLLVMIRANEESETKAVRVKAAIRRLCEQWQAGTFRGVIRNGKDPNWVEWSGTGWNLIPARVEAVHARPALAGALICEPACDAGRLGDRAGVLGEQHYDACAQRGAVWRQVLV